MDFTVPVQCFYADGDIGDNQRFVFYATVFRAVMHQYPSCPTPLPADDKGNYSRF